jgi:uncharacterized protein YhaN
MSKKQKEQTVTINEVEHKVSDLTQEQLAYVNHVADLERKMSSSQFNLDQLSIGRDAFMNMLTESLKVADSEPAKAE